MYVAVLKDPSARDARISPLIHTRCDLPAELDFSHTHDNDLLYEFRLAQLMADLDDSRERPMDFDLFCATRDGP